MLIENSALYPSSTGISQDHRHRWWELSSATLLTLWNRSSRSSQCFLLRTIPRQQLRSGQRDVQDSNQLYLAPPGVPRTQGLPVRNSCLNLVWKQLLLQITFVVSEQVPTLTTQTERVCSWTPPSRMTCFKIFYYSSHCLIFGVSGLRHSFKTFSEGGKDGKMKEWRRSETQRFYIIYMI